MRKVGDEIKAAIGRAGWSDVEVLLTRDATAAWTSLLPATGGQFSETPTFDQGLDGTLDIHYYTQSLELQYLQSDVETLEDLFTDAIYAQFTVTGLQVRLWRLDGIQTITIPVMRFVVSVVGDGYASPLAIVLKGTSRTLLSIFRPLETPPEL